MTVQPSILVGVDGTERDRDALALAQLLAKPSDAQLALVTVVPVPPAPWFENDWLSDETRDIARDVLERAREVAGEAADVTLRAVEAPSPAHGLARVAEELGAVAIVVGRTHRGRLTHLCGTRGSGPLGALLLGSVSSFLSHEAACPVLAVPRGVPSLVSHRRTGIASAGTRA